MLTINFRNWQFIVDKELTEQTYAKYATGSPELCGCNNCLNFANYREQVYPEEIRQLFAALGVDYRKEAEIAHYFKTGDGLHYYGGWFHFKGKFIGKDCAISQQGGGHTFDMTAITENFSIGFHMGFALTLFEDRKELVQVEFSAYIPWTIDKALETD